jgi:multiple antibiotic resistance protein
MWYGLGAAIVTSFLALFPIVNPIGGAPFFFGLTAGDPPSYRQSQARLTALYVALILGVFLLAGRPLLTFFGISLAELQVAGGLLVAHTAWTMLAASDRHREPSKGPREEGQDIAFTPMALPLLAGPGSIGIIIGLAADFRRPEQFAGALIAIIAIAAVCYLCLAAADVIMERLGEQGVDAVSRILGFFILAIAIRLIAEGVGGLFPGRGV